MQTYKKILLGGAVAAVIAGSVIPIFGIKRDNSITYPINSGGIEYKIRLPKNSEVERVQFKKLDSDDRDDAIVISREPWNGKLYWNIDGVTASGKKFDAGIFGWPGPIEVGSIDADGRTYIVVRKDKEYKYDAEFWVFGLENGKLSYNRNMSEKLENTKSYMAGIVTSASMNNSEKQSKLRRTWENNPQLATLAALSMGGEPLQKQLYADLGLQKTFEYSQIAGQNLIEALVAIAGGNLRGGLARAAATALIGRQAEIAVREANRWTTTGSSTAAGESNGVGKHAGGFYALSDGQAYCCFPTYEEAQRETERLKEAKRNEYGKREVQTTTDPRTGTTRTEYIYGTKKQAEDEMLRKSIEAGNRQVAEDVNRAAQEAQKSMDQLMKDVQKGIDDLFKQK